MHGPAWSKTEFVAALKSRADRRRAQRLFELHDSMPDLMDFIDEEPAMPEITFHTPQGSQAMVVHGAPARTTEAAWGPSTQAAVTRFLTFAITTKT